MDAPGLPPLFRPTRGNLAALLLVDSRLPGWAQVEPAVLRAFGHMGVPYAMRDLADGPLGAEEVVAHPVIVIGQEGLGASIGLAGASLLLDALADGVGVVSLDPGIGSYGKAFCEALRVAPSDEERPSHVFRSRGRGHWIAESRGVGEEVEAVRPVRVRSVRAGGAILLSSGDGRPVLTAGRHGRGRWVYWAAAPEIWLQSHLGHGQGLDGLFWRSLVWCARKPFVMNAMPPFVTARIDDVCGINSLWWVLADFGATGAALPRPIVELLCDVVPGGRSTAYQLTYLDVLNRHGYIPNLGVFLDQMGEAEWARLRDKSEAGLVEPFAHAFSDHISPDGVRTVDFIYRGSPSLPGRYGEPWSAEDPPTIARAKFERVDGIWKERGIRSARSVNSHWHAPSVTALPLLKERGQVYLMSASLPDISLMDEEAYQWRLGPYGPTGSSRWGRAGYVMDYVPMPQGAEGVETGDFFCVCGSWWNRGTAEHPQSDPEDFLCTEAVSDPRAGRGRNDVEGAARRLAQRLRVGLDSLFFGILFCHEQHLAVLTEEELEGVLSEADRLTDNLEKRFVSYDEVAEYARSRFDTHIEEAVVGPEGRVWLRLSGGASVPLLLSAYRDDGERCVRQFREVGPFEGAAEVRF